jgi:hypothetical protein
MIVGATSRDASAQDPGSVDDLARAGHEKKLAGTMLIVGGSALVVTGIGLTIGGFASDDRTRCRGSGGYYYYSDGGRDGYYGGGAQCWNQALVVAGGATWLVGAVTLGIGIPVYVIGARQLRDAARLRRWFSAPPPPPPPPYPPPPPPP